jgi:hypothetical protein
MPGTPVTRLARKLGLGLHAHGVCQACLGMVAMELEFGDDRSVAGTIRMVVPNLWAEGLGGPVEDALHSATRKGVPDAREALRDFEARGPRSDIFRAIVRRLAEDLKEEVDRTYRASLN